MSTCLNTPSSSAPTPSWSFRSYTSLEPKTVEDIRHVTAVEGTELTLLCRLNKDVATARLVDAEGQAIELEPHEDGNHVYRATLTLADPRRFQVQLVDREGRTNKLATEIVANVTRNRPPVVKMTQPAHDVEVSPLEELKLKAELEDDFGLVRHGLSLQHGGPRASRDRPAGSQRPRPGRLRPEHLLDFESLNAAPDQLLTYFFWAEDIGPDGQPRRTSGDMFFAEVRPFEEIFRQGEQPPSGSAENEEQEGQQGNARASDQLAELQKEIINGTWKLIRRETRAKPTDKLAEDGKVLEESQHAAIEQAAQLAERLQDAASKANLEQAIRSMKDAEKHLTEVAQKSSMPALSPALAAEQAAYQALLKLRAREFEVIRRNSRQQRQSGQNAGGNRSQRQLQQLELTDEENRYEDQRTARAQQERLSQREREQRETRQVLNRLRELAQRQNDVNDRLKELQSALEAAKTQPAREEIERQLKRLREQQQQILRDTDELRERMEREENRDRMADARAADRPEPRARPPGLRGTRGRPPPAGPHRRRTSRPAIQRPARRASQESGQPLLRGNDRDARPGAAARRESEKALRAARRRQGPAPDLAARHRRTQAGHRGSRANSKRTSTSSSSRCATTVQDAEETEPLLAKNLYDTVRKANEQKIPDALKAAEQLVDLGVAEDAAKASRHAGQGIEQLREGVERSARSVLGDETAALRRAQGELEDLADQVNREIAQATGQEPVGTTTAERTERSATDNAPSQGQDAATRWPAGRRSVRRRSSSGTASQADQAARNSRGRTAGQHPKHAARTARSTGQRATGSAQPAGPADGEQGQQGQPGEQDGQGQQGEQAQEGNKDSRAQPGRARPARTGTGPGRQRSRRPATADRDSDNSKAVEAVRCVGAVADRQAAAPIAQAGGGTGGPGAGRSPARGSGSGPTGCATSRNCSTTPNCEPRPRGSAIGLGERARNSNATPRCPTGTS